MSWARQRERIQAERMQSYEMERSGFLAVPKFLPVRPAEKTAPVPDFLVPPWKRIIQETCEAHGVSQAEILSTRRSPRIVRARHEAMFRMHAETSLSFPQIGRRMGGRDHTSVMYAVRRHAELNGIREGVQ